jgi:Zn-dependent protease with chaperone function
MNTFKSWAILIILFVTIPIIGIIASTLVPQSNELTQINLGYISWATLVLSCFSLLSIPILSKATKKNRKALFYLFRPGLFLAQIISAILVMANSAILVFSIYLLESFYTGRVHIILIGAIGFVAVFAAFIVCTKALTPIKKMEVRIIGKSLPKSDYPVLWRFIESIAERIGTTPPTSIIVGLEPNFFVTEVKVICLDGEMKGKSMYLSLPFCRVLTQEELTAIIGHEMGHFVGEDTLWSKKFYPIYRGSTETLYTLYSSSNSEKEENNNGLIQLAFLPALYFMSFFMSSFEKAEKEISRERELKADSIGAKITSPELMAKVLLKVHIYPHAWQYTQEKMKEALENGKQLINISSFFWSLCELIPSDFMKDDIGKSRTSHPTDSHPPLSERLNSIGIQLSEIYTDGIKPPIANTAIELIGDASKIEEELSEIEHYRLVQLGIKTPKIATDAKTNDPPK